jgi:hypothetical protein
MQLAEFNIGVLKYDWDDLQLADFRNNLDRVYDLATRAPGYVWHLQGDEMEAAQLDPHGVLGGNPRTASTLSVWDGPQALYDFTFKTVHQRFYARGPDWYDPSDQPARRFVMWWVAPGHRPGLEEACARLDLLTQKDASDAAFDWAYLQMGAS